MMKRLNYCFVKLVKFIAGSIFCLYFSSTVYAANQTTDMIVFNAKVTTQNLAQLDAVAIAIRDGLILKVGSNKEILGLKTRKTKVIDAKGHRMIPGLNDSHLHVVRGG